MLAQFQTSNSLYLVLGKQLGMSSSASSEAATLLGVQKLKRLLVSFSHEGKEKGEVKVDRSAIIRRAGGRAPIEKKY